MSLKDKIIPEKLPLHIAIIMDGNGRWAKQKGMLRVLGHKNGVTAVRETAETAAELGIKYLTLYAFSTENWNRPRLEVDTLMELLVSTINKEKETLRKNNIRLLAIGDLEQLPASCRNELAEAIQDTQHHTGLSLVIALSYSSRWEITEAVRKISQKVLRGEMQPGEITEKTVSQNLCTAAYPDPELLIRTSGEYRISNYLLWQIAYAELYFTPKLWPDFRKEDLYEAIINYQQRERRFGKVSEQLNQ
jgi:undecaprenyl diphosphate synthase